MFQKLLRLPLAIYFFLFWIVTSILYFPTLDSKFVSDYMQWASRYEAQGWSGIYQSFGDVSLKYGYHFLMFSCYKIFGWNAFGWHLLMTGIHALNATLIIVFLRKLIENLRLKLKAIPHISSVLFLLSPFHTETVVWAAAIHFIVMPTLLLGAIILAFNYLNNKKVKSLIGLFLLFTIGLYTTEAIIILPVILGLLLLVICIVTNISWWSSARFISITTLPMLAIIVLFMWHTQLTYGSAIGHYGAETHLNIDIKYIIANYNKYIAKFLLFFPLLPLDHYFWINKLQGTKAFVGFITVLITVVTLLIYSIRKRKNSLLFILVLFVCFLIALLPVINLENQSIHSVQTDRYSYIASIFYYAFIVSVIFILFGKIKWLILSTLLTMNLIGLSKNIIIWKENGQLFQSLIHNFPVGNKLSKIYILNLADSYKGAYLLRNGLNEALRFKHKPQGEFNIATFGYINMLAYTDSVKVSAIQDSLHTIVGDWGRWFQFYGNGSVDSSVLFYGVHGAYEFSLRFRDSLGVDDKVIYQKGEIWRDITEYFPRKMQ